MWLGIRRYRGSSNSFTRVDYCEWHLASPSVRKRASIQGHYFGRGDNAHHHFQICLFTKPIPYLFKIISLLHYFFNDIEKNRVSILKCFIVVFLNAFWQRGRDTKPITSTGWRNKDMALLCIDTLCLHFAFYFFTKWKKQDK